MRASRSSGRFVGGSSQENRATNSSNSTSHCERRTIQQNQDGDSGAVASVGGVGDDAYYATMKTGRSTVTTLNVKKGDTAVIIRVSGGTKPVEEYQAKEKAVAQAIVPKL
jgi:hypothetical protein